MPEAEGAHLKDVHSIQAAHRFAYREKCESQNGLTVVTQLPTLKKLEKVIDVLLNA